MHPLLDCHAVAFVTREVLRDDPNVKLKIGNKINSVLNHKCFSPFSGAPFFSISYSSYFSFFFSFSGCIRNITISFFLHSWPKRGPENCHVLL